MVYYSEYHILLWFTMVNITIYYGFTIVNTTFYYGLLQ